MTNVSKTLIVGLGNPLMGDDGVGNYIIAELTQKNLPDHIKLIDCGTDILKILSHLENIKKIIFIDALDAYNKPGTIYQFQKEEILAFPGQSRTAHFISVIESIRLLDQINQDFHQAEIQLIGIQPEKVELHNTLSPSVKQAAWRIIQKLEEELMHPGY